MALIVGIIGIVTGQAIMNTGALASGVLPYAIGASAVGVAAWLATPRPAPAAPRRWQFTGEQTLVFVLAMVALGGALATYRLAYGKTLFDSAWDVAIAWFASFGMLALIAIVGSPRPRPALSRQRIAAWPWPTIAAMTAVLAVALALRLWRPNAFSTVSTGDDWFHALTAREFRDGVIPNPFQTHMWLVPMDLLTAIRGWTSRPFPDEVASYRLFGALYGVATVFGVFLLGRRLLGTAIGIAGAAVLACMSIHIWGSRITMNNSWDAFSMVFALWALARAVDTRHRRDAILCGVFTALGIYGYWGGRVFLVFIALCLPVILIGPGLGDRIADALRLAIWIVVGFAVTAAPAAAFFTMQPNQFMGRTNIVTQSIQPSWTERAELVFRAVLFPFYARQGSDAASFYRQAPPFLGWSIAPFLAIGAVTWIGWLVVQLRSRGERPERPAMLLLAWAVTVLPISQTESMGSQRFFAVMPMWALAAGTGIVVAIGAIRGAIASSRDRRLAVALCVAIGAGLMADAAYQTFVVQPTLPVDLYAIRSYDLGWRLHEADPDLMVLQAGWPEISYAGAGAWRFLAPGLDGHLTAFDEPFDTGGHPAPTIQAGQLLILSPERHGETCAILARNPGVAIAEGRMGDETLLYLVFARDPAFAGMQPGTTSPAGLTLTPLPPPAC